MRRSIELGKRCGRHWPSAAALALLLATGCVPRAARPSAPPPSAPGFPGALPGREPAVRVGILVDTSAVELSAPGGLDLLAPDGDLLHRSGAGEAVTLGADGVGRLRIAGAPAPGGATLVTVRPVRGEAVTIGGKTYRGDAFVRTTGPGRLTAVNRVEMEEYLLGVVPREIGRVGPERFEAAKAQAVAARTYAVRYLGRREALGFDVFATVQDQVYGGVGDEYDLVSRAVRETEGEILTYAGQPIEAYYHSTCAGQTAAIEEVWNQAPVPYLRSVRDVDPRTGQAYDHFSSRFRWEQRWSADELETILARTLADSLRSGMSSVGELRDLEVLERTGSGRIRRLRITTSTGDFIVGGDRIRWIFLTPAGALLNSSRFDVAIRRGPGGEPVEVVATGGGWGHGIGMCQVGAMGRAEAGQDYRTILQAYYTGARVVDLY
jgi:stage II sporulation protein D